MHHRDHHPTDVPGCFGCKASSIGFQGLVSAHGPDPTRRVPVVIDDGPHRGKVGGYHTEHWTGAQDATVRAGHVKASIAVKEER